MSIMGTTWDVLVRMDKTDVMEAWLKENAITMISYSVGMSLQPGGIEYRHFKVAIPKRGADILLKTIENKVWELNREEE